MNKADMIARIAEENQISKAAASRVLENFSAMLADDLKENGETTLPGIGRFLITERSARTGRNPLTGDPVEIAASKGVKFRAAKALKDALN